MRTEGTAALFAPRQFPDYQTCRVNRRNPSLSALRLIKIPAV